MIIVNFKNVKIGKEVLAFSKKIDRLDIIVSVPSFNIKEISNNTSLKVFSQHVDSRKGKGETGFLTALSTKKAGATGTLLNHNDHPLSLAEIKKSVKECHKNKLKVIICVKNLKMIGELIKLKPFAIAYEESKLIGTKDSITNYPLKVKKFVAMFRDSKVIPLCGAGINSSRDVVLAKELGCEGVLISSVVMKAENPRKVLKDMALK